MPDFVKNIIAPETIWGSFLMLTVGGLIFYVLTSGLSHLYYFVWRKERFFPNEKLDPKQMWLERKWAVYSLLGNAVLTTPIHHFIVNGKSRVYNDVSEYGVPWLLASILLMLVITETLVYWAHRFLHHPIVYKKIHLHHHQFRVTTPWASVAFHPLDSFLQAAPTHLCAFLFPMHAGVYGVGLVLLMIWSVFIHERVTFMRVPLLNNTMHHTAHHKFNKYNYGQYLTIWDRMMGTYKNPLGLVEDGWDRSVPVNPHRSKRAEKPVQGVAEDVAQVPATDP